MGNIGCSETPGTTNPRCVTSQGNEGLISSDGQAGQRCVTERSGHFPLFLLALGLTRFHNQMKPENLFFGKKAKEVSRTELQIMWKRISILHSKVQGQIRHKN
jgi:hypothetical protein